MIQLQNISKSFGTKTLFDGLTYQFPANEKIAIYGSNGAGKTTLLNIICRQENPDDGQLIQPDGVRVGYLPQIANPNPQQTITAECLTGAKEAHAIEVQLQELEMKMSEGTPDSQVIDRYEQLQSRYRLLGGYRLEAEASRILTGLGFSDEQLKESPETLSGGWRMRLELAKIFLDRPQILVLDEPTNHLDLPSLVWVEKFLKNYEHTVILVSHDRNLLNSIPTMILHLQAGEMSPYKGNFDQFLEQREQKMEEMMQQKEQLRKRREHMQKFVDRFGAKNTKATQAQSRVKMIAKIRDLESSIQIPDDDRTMQYKIPEPSSCGRVVYEVKEGAIGYDRPLHSAIRWLIEKKQKVAVVGANGVGKSTLLKTMAQKISPLSGAFEKGYNVALAHFDQEQEKELEHDRTVFENLVSRADLGQSDARSLLGAFLFSGGDVDKKVGVLSGGEKSRVGLSILFAQKANLLLLDEPTNHLDMSSVESLILALSEYEGTVVFVSHDRHFIDQVCTHVLVLYKEDELLLYEGKLSDYERFAKHAGLPLIFSDEEQSKKTASTKPVESPANSHEDRKEKKRQRQKLERAIEKFEKRMDALREEISALEEDLHTVDPSDATKLHDLHQRHVAKQSELEEIEMEWMEKSEILENLDPS